jgi:hypothetical protein
MKPRLLEFYSYVDTETRPPIFDFRWHGATTHYVGSMINKARTGDYFTGECFSWIMICMTIFRREFIMNIKWDYELLTPEEARQGHRAMQRLKNESN